MDKSALQSYSLWAKAELERQIELSLKLLGINSINDIKSSKLQGDITVIEGDSKSYSKDTYQKRNHIISLIKRKGYEQTIEELSYTWFNRIIAIRFMEVHDYLPHGFRVLSSKSGNFEPDILMNLSLVAKDLNLDYSYCMNLKDKGNVDELYRYVFFKQCYSLSKILPMLFSEDLDYLELLLPQSLLKGETIITKLVEIGEENFLDDIEVIGWLYQYYIQLKKDEVFGGLKNNTKLTKSTLPAATQIFTPDWIVKYMVDNSLGKLWIERTHDSQLKKQLKYYLDPKNTNQSTVQDLDPKQIKFLDDCSGSGHILIYAFDLFYQMYLEKGYSSRDISKLILENNLFGFDLDKRACQLASFALTMKARKHDARFFEEDRVLLPNILEIEESNDIPLSFIDSLKELKTISKKDILIIKYVIDSFRDAKLYGSLIRIELYNYDSVINSLKLTLEPFRIAKYSTIFTNDLLYSQIPVVIKLLEQAKLFVIKFDCVVANPPYMGNKSLPIDVRTWLSKNYPNTKSDLFSAFIERNFEFSKRDGYIGFMSPFVWMFISSYESLRKMIIGSKSISSLIQLEYSGFAEAAVPICTFILRNSKSILPGQYIRLSDFKGSGIQHSKVLECINDDKCKYKFLTKIDFYDYIPGSPIAYWLSEKEILSFKNPKLDKVVQARVGLITGDNNRFLRLWHEVSFNKIHFKCLSLEENKLSGLKWYPYNKGGNYRKWYGNNEYVINWQEDGKEAKYDNYSGERVKSHNYNGEFAYKKGITWSSLTSGNFSCRLSDEGFLFDAAGPLCYVENEKELFIVLGYLLSNISKKLLGVLNPTLNMHPGYLQALPYLSNISINYKNKIIELVSENVYISRNEWDSYETSWSFRKHPIIKENCKDPLSVLYSKWKTITQNRISILQKNEVALNKIFIDVYGLSNDIDSTIDLDEITLRKANVSNDVKSLISYYVGLLFGRFSISKMEINSRPVNEVLPMYMIFSEENLSLAICKLIKKIHGQENYLDNIDFIAEGLMKKANETSIETLERYLKNDFYKDHLKTYQKRPIYWMFCSGSQKAFKCLLYMHQYNENTLANINSQLFLPHMQRLRNEIESIDFRIKNESGNNTSKLEMLKNSYNAQLNEMIDYGQVLEHKALEYISLDLDDGVFENYKKFQNVEVPTNSGHPIKMNLLEPLK